MAEFTSGVQTKSASGEAEPEVLGKQISSLALCYVSCSKDSGNAFVGAALVTDHRTRPLEFCYVAPIRPTTIQRLLYGKSLDEHVNVDVMVKKLLEGLSRVPDIIFVDSELLLETSRLCPVPIALLKKSPDKSSPGPRLSQYTYQVPENSRYADAVSQAVGVLETQIQLCDPFDRITEALKEALRSKP
jgi:hypothetical protein